MLEPAVTLTDYVLALQCAAFCALLARHPGTKWWIVLFGGLCAASAVGGTVHGFIADKTSTAHHILWGLSLLAFGIVTLAAWQVGAGFLKSAKAAVLVRRLALAQFLAFSAVIILYAQKFIIAALNYFPAALFLLFVFARRWFRNKEKAALWGAAGMVLIFCGSFVQIFHLAPSPQHFNHNALYHVVEFFALIALFRAARGDIKTDDPHQT